MTAAAHQAAPGRHLPLPLTSLIGRESESEALRARLIEDEVRLLTLLGPGGSGKTRLAIEVARRFAEEDGVPVVFVELVSLTDATAILPAIAKVVPGCDETSERLTDSVVHELTRFQPLLVLDNLEQIAGAGAVVASLLELVPGLTVLATSRVPLRLSAEQRWPVSPLPLPVTGDLASAKTNAAVQLFVARARLAQAGFELNDGNVADVVDIVGRLDGLPLAIELAAARVRLLSPAALRARLDRRLTILVGGPADLPSRQQRMRDTIAWSYELLGQEDQMWLRRLSVFAPGFSLSAAESMAGAPMLDTIERLVDHSLLLPDGTADSSEPRFRMLETIREFLRDELSARDELRSAECALVDWLLEFARRMTRTRPRYWDAVWDGTVAAEEAQALAVLELLERTGPPAQFLELAHFFGRHWVRARREWLAAAWLRRGLEQSPGDQSPVAANAHYDLGWIFVTQDRMDDARAHLAQADVAYRALHADQDVMRVQYALGQIDAVEGRWDDALTRLRSFYAATLESDNPAAAYSALAMIGEIERAKGESALAREHLHSALRFAQSQGIAEHEISRLVSLAVLELAENNLQTAESHASIAANQAQERRLPGLEAEARLVIAGCGVRAGDCALARTAAAEALRCAEVVGYPKLMVEVRLAQANARLLAGEPASGQRELIESLTNAAGVLPASVLGGLLHDLAPHVAAAQAPAEAARCMGAAAAAIPGVAPYWTGWHQAIHDRLGKGRFQELFREGQSLPAKEAISRAIAALNGAPGPDPYAGAASSRIPSKTVTTGERLLSEELTTREREVLRLVAAGQTNAQIGESLFISPLTAKTHVANLLGKLGVENRAAAATWAASNGLVAV